MDRAAQEEEKKKLIDDFFNYAEVPIQEWLAEYLGENVEAVFPDYTDNSKDIGFQSDGKYYIAYYTTMGPDEPSQVPKELLNNEQGRKACSMLFDAFQMVMPNVVQTADKEYADGLKGIHFKFDESRMAFELAIMNTSKCRKIMLIQQRQKLLHINTALEAKLAELNNPTSEVTAGASITDIDALKKEITDQQKQIDELLNKSSVALDAITDKEMSDEDARCETVAKTLPEKNKVYIVVEESDPDDEEVQAQSMQRLPVFGLAYQDTEDETFTERLKKQYNMND
jgi:hypothetical protein